MENTDLEELLGVKVDDSDVVSMTEVKTRDGNILCAPVTENTMKENGFSDAEIEHHKQLFITSQASKNEKFLIDKHLKDNGVDSREQLVATANATQLALAGLSTLVIACSKSSDEVLNEAAQPLLPFAESFIAARDTGFMPVDILGVEEVAESIIRTTITTGVIVKQAMAQGT